MDRERHQEIVYPTKNYTSLIATTAIPAPDSGWRVAIAVFDAQPARPPQSTASAAVFFLRGILFYGCCSVWHC
mgnify:CR=1 FL=1